MESREHDLATAMQRRVLLDRQAPLTRRHGPDIESAALGYWQTCPAGPMNARRSFEDALAEALERCSLGENPETAAAHFPDHDLLPYLQLAKRLRALPSSELSPEGLGRSLARLLREMDDHAPFPPTG
jgi:hypothetical protein